MAVLREYAAMKAQHIKSTMSWESLQPLAKERIQALLDFFEEAAQSAQATSTAYTVFFPALSSKKLQFLNQILLVFRIPLHRQKPSDSPQVGFTVIHPHTHQPSQNEKDIGIQDAMKLMRSFYRYLHFW